MRTLRTLGTFLLTMTTALPTAAQPISMQRDDVPSTDGARGITIADLNRDGWLDIATANHAPGADGVSVLLNRGASGGYTPSFIPIAGGPFDITSADLNKDGVPDLVVANPDVNEINVLFGLAAGGFREPLHIGGQFNARGLAVGDIDKDGNPDIVYTLYYNQGFQVIYGDGAGNFVRRVGSGTVGVNPQGVAIADFNMDGWPDLVVASSTTVGLTILYQTPGGFGSFTRQDLAVPAQQNVVTVADVDRDGRPDIAAASTATSDITIVLNRPTGMQALVYPSGGGSPRGIAAIDLDRDGAPDIVTGNRGSNTVQVLPGHGDGTFGAAYGFAAGTGARTVATGDLDHDGRIDIVSGNEYAAAVTVLSNTTTFTQSAYAFERRLLGAPNGGFSGGSSADVADFDLDGRYDAVTLSADRGAVVLLADGRSTKLETLPFGPVAIHAAQLNSDAYPDVVLLDQPTPGDHLRLESYLGAGNGQFPGRRTIETLVYAADLQLADFNRDGRIDVAVVGGIDDYASPAAVEIYFGTGNGAFTRGPRLSFPRTNGKLIVGDVNRDGAIDVVAFSAGTTSTVYTWLNDGAGHFGATPRTTSVAGLMWISGGDLGDVDDDGWLDLVVGGYPADGDAPNHGMVLLRGGPSGFAAEGHTIAVGDYNTFPPHLADITLDGHLDLLAETGAILPGHGDGTFGPPQAFDYYAPGLIVLDVDKNGLPDVFARDADGSVQIILNQHRDTNLPPSVSLGEDWTVQYRAQFGDGEFEFSARGVDPDLHRLSFKWFDENGTLLADTGSFAFWTPPFMNPGQHQFTVEASDGRGASARDSIVVNVLHEKEVVIWTGGSYHWAQGDKWGFVDDATAAGGSTAHDRNDGAPKATAPSASPASYAEVEFVADPTLTYKLWVRLKADADYWGNDSVWIQMTGAVDASGRTFAPGSTSGIEVNLEECSGCGVSGWGWRDEAWGQKDAIGSLTLRFPGGGSQRLRLQTREDGVRVDQVVLSSEQYVARRPGTVKNDVVILPASFY